MDISLKTGEIEGKLTRAHLLSLLPVLLAIELSLHCQMSDQPSKFEKDRAKLWSISWKLGISYTQNKHCKYTFKWFYICPTLCVALDREQYSD